MLTNATKIKIKTKSKKKIMEWNEMTREKRKTEVCDFSTYPQAFHRVIHITFVLSDRAPVSRNRKGTDMIVDAFV